MTFTIVSATTTTTNSVPSKGQAWRLNKSPCNSGNENQKATYYCSYLGHQNEVTFAGGISERRPKSERTVFIRLFRIRGPSIY